MRERNKREYLNLCKVFGNEVMYQIISFKRYCEEREKHTQREMIESIQEINNLN
jgi:hypothetical protein